jgi:N-acetylglutamate synthase-like GNAT family acetyltransferase
MEITREFNLRPATKEDAREIHKIIRNMNLNPMNLNWQHFILAVDRVGKLIGCGQIKKHTDGSSELASVAVLPEMRGNGIARNIILSLLEKHPGRLYLTCGTSIVALYEKFGFKEIPPEEFTPYFRRLSRLANYFNKLFDSENRMVVMRRN